jgi:DNA-binding transcriptional ArsR family regulator
VVDNEADALLDASLSLDEVCSRILRILLEDRTQRFSELQNALTKMYGTEITHKVLSKHLKHLEGKNLVKRTEEGFQNVTYALSDKFRNVVRLPPDEIKKYLELQDDDSLPPELRPLKITVEEFYGKMSRDEIDRETDRDLHDIMSLNLWELKLSIDNDLLLKEGESDDSFWLYFIKPTYRIKMESASEKCRYNEEYRKMLFEKIELLTTALRSDRELFRKRRDAGKRVRA